MAFNAEMSDEKKIDIKGMEKPRFFIYSVEYYGSSSN